MAVDEGLAQRVREVLQAEGVEPDERRMFGGLAFMVEGNMVVGIVDDRLMARVDKEAYEDLLAEPHAREMDFTGRPMRGFLFVDPPGVERDEDLERWVGRCLSYVSTLPPK